MEKISVNSNICDGCLNCENMCASVHTASRIKIIEHQSSFYGIVCQHCESAPCIKICPTDAISDEKVDTEKCIGCGLCVKTCPNEAITVTDFLAHIDQSKCTGCGACKEKCPKKAII